MTPDEFRETVLPGIVAAWDDQCFCGNPVFQKPLSFNFRNYDIGPAGLADSEVLIDEIIRRRFSRQGGPKSHQGEITKDYICPQCEAVCTDFYAEFSISMRQSTVTCAHNPQLAPLGLYLIGFYGFKRSEFAMIVDFRRASTTDEFIGGLKAA